MDVPAGVWGLGFCLSFSLLVVLNRGALAVRLGGYAVAYEGRLASAREAQFILGDHRAWFRRYGLAATSVSALAWLFIDLSVALLVLGVLLWLPFQSLRLSWGRRADRFDGQVVDAARSLASSMRAGLVLPAALEVIVENMSSPMSEEMSVVLKEHALGVPIEAGLARVARRYGSEHFYSVLNAIQIAGRSGGDIPRVLDDTATALAEIRRMEGKIRAVTSQGRMQIFIMASIPPLFMALIYMVQPHMIRLLFDNPVGQLILLAIVALEGVGIALMRKIVTVEV